MQVTPLPPGPIAPGLITPEAIARAVPQVQAQAAAPIIQRAVDPARKQDRGNKNKSNGDRGKGGGSDKGGRGSSVNIRV